MCGFNGFVTTEKRAIHFEPMILNHRGPDAFGRCSGSSKGYRYHLEHYRLSIIDLDARSNQPFSDGMHTLVFNGEIYNYRELREKLKKHGVQFKTGSDTEVLFNGLVLHGIDYLNELDGMYSFAFLDLGSSQLTLCRDPVGAKPLYYCVDNKSIKFSSELKAIKPRCCTPDTLDFSALLEYLRYGYIPSPKTPYKEAKKVQPGSYLKISFSKDEFIVEQKKFHKIMKTPNPEPLLETVIKSVERRFVSDLPIGLFLSGGIDSSLVAAISARELGRTDLQTYTVSFDGPQNEANTAKVTANLLGLSNEIVNFDDRAALRNYWDYFPMIDEPFSDSSFMPSFELSKFASDYGKVFLSADGGDELFFGYQKYLTFLRYQKLRLPLKLPFRTKNYKLNRYIKFWNVLAESNELQKYRQFLRYFDISTLNAHFLPKYKSLIKDMETNNLEEVQFSQVDNTVMRLEDFHNYLPDNIMFKCDRASMLSSIEVREPLLSVNLINQAFSHNSLDFFYDGTKGKLPLRNLLSAYLPEHIMSLPKKGFSPPMRSWIYEHEYNNILSMLSKKTIEKFGIFDHNFVSNYYLRELKRTNKNANFLDRIWTFYVLLRWLDHNCQM